MVLFTGPAFASNNYFDTDSVLFLTHFSGSFVVVFLPKETLHGRHPPFSKVIHVILYMYLCIISLNCNIENKWQCFPSKILYMYIY